MGLSLGMVRQIRERVEAFAKLKRQHEHYLTTASYAAISYAKPLREAYVADCCLQAGVKEPTPAMLVNAFWWLRYEV